MVGEIETALAGSLFPALVFQYNTLNKDNYYKLYGSFIWALCYIADISITFCRNSAQLTAFQVKMYLT